jgi:hypothetical protein
MTLTLLEQINALRNLWQMLLPHVPAPDPLRLNFWLSYPVEAIERGVHRTSRKFALGKPGPVNPEIAYRYCQGVISNETRQKAA